MSSSRHEKIRKMLLSAAEKLKSNDELPKLQKMRPALEVSTLFSLLPWGVRFKPITLTNKKCVRTLDAEAIIPLHPDNTNQVVLYFHGGGYTLGSSHTHRGMVGRIAKEINKVCILVEYRKAPEHTYPAALEDAVFSYMAMLERGKKPEDIILAGDSAGGGMILAAMVDMKERGISLPVAAVCLSPWCDLTNSSASILKNEAFDPLVDIKKMTFWASLYAGEFPLDDPKISPFYADLSGLPPLLIQTSNAEMLYNDATRIAKKAKEAGVKVTIQEFDGLMHWWHLFQKTIPEAREAIAKVAKFINFQFKQKMSLIV